MMSCICERCGMEGIRAGWRYCYRCRQIMVKRMRDEGYLTWYPKEVDDHEAMCKQRWADEMFWDRFMAGTVGRMVKV